MEWCYLSALVLAAVGAALRRCWWLWSALTSWAALAALVLIGSPTDARWLRGTWAPAEAASIVLSACAVVRAAILETRPLPMVRRFWLRFGSAAVALSLVGLIWLPVHHTDAYWIFVALRARFWEWAALTLGILLALTPGLPRPETVFLAVVALDHAVIGALTYFAWPYEQLAFRAILTVACCWWLSPLSRCGSVVAPRRPC